MVAAGLTGVYSEPIPNFEVLTLVVFSSGVLLGETDGMLVGAISELIYTLLNPYGAAHPLVMFSQILGMTVAGGAGGMAARFGLSSRPVVVRAALLGLAAVVLTSFFDLVTNLASGIVTGQMRLILLGGIPFFLFHVGTNVVLFAVIGTPLVGVFEHYRLRLSS